MAVLIAIVMSVVRKYTYRSTNPSSDSKDKCGSDYTYGSTNP